jgi:hypothetical protein
MMYINYHKIHHIALVEFSNFSDPFKILMEDKYIVIRSLGQLICIF